jgi:NADH-quinone oxidoreductase subunit G
VSEPDGTAVVTLTVDGKEVTVPAGTLIIRAAEELGIEIPRFCDHPLLDPVAACRQCYVSVEGQRKLMTSCSTPVQDGMAVHTQFTDPEVQDAQEAVLEFLLINHPLDCPVCDRGGECPLQDQALAFGPGESRYTEAKRTYRKPIPLSPLVNLDRERCVLCARCTRFCDQISGDRFIELFDRGAAEQVAIAPGEDFRSPFSGNTIQICPVGALTATSYRFSARPFDLKSGDSICPHCACGCNLRVDLRRGEVVRHLARDNGEVNDAWLCDKGRFAFRFADRTERLVTPLLRDRGLEPVSFREALGAVAGWCDGKPVAFLAGGRLSDEDAYAMSKLARTAFGTNDLDHRWGGTNDVPLEVEGAQAAGAPVTYRDVERARVILVVGLDAEQELPILHLRIRKAVRLGASAFVVHPRRTRLWDVARHIPCAPGGEAELIHGLPDAEPETMAGRLWASLQEAAGDAVVLAGHRMSGSPGALAQLAQMAEAVGARFAITCRRANDRGALRGGVHPALLPGGRSVESEDGRAPVEVAWGTLLPDAPGRDTKAILEAAANREIEVLFLVGVDPLRDFPDAALVRRALENVRYKVVVDVARDAMEAFADVMLPALPYLEKDGHYTDWEGRSQRLRPVRNPDGLGRGEWEIFQELSVICGHDMGFSSLDALHEEMGRLLGSGATAAGAGRDVATAVDGRQPVRSPSARLTGAQPAYAPPPEPESVGTGSPQLLLFTYPLLVDDGRLSVGADELRAALGEVPFVEVHPSDAARLGLVDGEPAVVRTERGEARLPVRVTAGIVEGCVFVPYNQPGFAANAILSGSLTTSAMLEPAAAAVSA